MQLFSLLVDEESAIVSVFIGCVTVKDVTITLKMWYLVLLTPVIICVWFYWYLIGNFDYWKKRNVPFPKPEIWTGNFPNFWSEKVHHYYEYDKIYQDFKEHPFVGIFQVRTPKLMVIEPEVVKDVLIKSFKKFTDNEFSDFVHKRSDPLLGRNPFFVKGNEWKETRQDITPGFTSSRIKALFPIMDAMSQRITEYVKEHKNNGPFDIKEICAKYTIDVVSNCAFAIDAESFKTEKPEIREMARGVFNFSIRYRLYLAASNIFNWISKLNVAIMPKDCNDYFVNMMNSALDRRKKDKDNREDYLNYLLKLSERRHIDELLLAAHGVSFFGDGFETSSTVMAYALYEIAKNKDIQDRLRTEIEDVMEQNGNVNYDNILEMTYLEQVMCETLRIHPILAVLAKLCTETAELVSTKDKKVQVEKGTTVIIPIAAISLDERHFPEPNKFDPDRFSPENGGTKAYKEKCVYIPFGEGPRQCLGMRFGLAQIKRGIIEVIRKYEISVNKKTMEPLMVDPNVFLISPVGGIWINFKEIKA